jgi:adenine phosphoribosyltransferase
MSFESSSPLEPLKSMIRAIPDFPQKGVVFRDITPLLSDPDAFGRVIPALWAPWEGQRIDKVLGVEARGFILAAPVALHLSSGFVPVRKPGKLPYLVEQEEYELEYGTDSVEIHKDAISSGERVLIVDDVIATGGTALATARLVERLGGDVAGLSFLIEISALGGMKKLEGYEAHSLLKF